MEEISRYAGSDIKSAAASGRGLHKAPSGATRSKRSKSAKSAANAKYGSDHHPVQVMWLSSALVIESKVPNKWRNVTSNLRILKFNEVAREVRYTLPGLEG